MLKAWKKYEIRILDKLRKEFPSEIILPNQFLPGKISGSPRQVDILIKGLLGGFDINIVVECKYFNKKVDVKIVDGFIGFMEDVGAEAGILITNNGFTKGATKRILSKKIKIDVVEFAHLDTWHFEWDSCEACSFNGYHHEVEWGNEYVAGRGKTKVLIQKGNCNYCNTLHVKCNQCHFIICINEGEYGENQMCECENEIIVRLEYVGNGMNEDRIYLYRAKKEINFVTI